MTINYEEEGAKAYAKFLAEENGVDPFTEMTKSIFVSGFLSGYKAALEADLADKRREFAKSVEK